MYDGYIWPLTHKANPEDRTSPKIYNLWTPINKTKTEQANQQIYDCYGHRHTKQIQKTVEIQTFTNLRTPQHDMKPEPEKQQLYDGYGNRHTEPIQKPVEIQTFTNL